MFLVRNALAQVLKPGGDWDGTPGSGGSAPAENASVLGSGFDQKAIGNFDEYPHVWIESTDHEITVGAAIADRAWIKEVEFWLEGNRLIVNRQSRSKRGTIGWQVIPQSSATHEGDAILYAYIRPWNGFERRISIPLTLNTRGTIARPTHYIDYVNGNDGNAGTVGAPWKSFQKGAVAASNGAIVYYAVDQTYVEDSVNPAPFGNGNTRMIDMRPVTPGGRARITRSSHGSILLRCYLVTLDGIDFDVNKASGLQVTSNVGAVAVIKNASLIDPYGPTGPEFAYSTQEGAGFGFVSGAGQFGAVCETYVRLPSFGANMIRNVSGEISGDALILGSSVHDNLHNGRRVFNLELQAPLLYYNRISDIVNPAVATAVFGGVNTTLTWQGSPTLTSSPEGDVRFLTGPLAGQTFGLVSNGGSTTVISGDASAAQVGDTAFLRSPVHMDTAQYQIQALTDPVAENVYIQGFKNVSPFLQLVLGQRGQHNQSGTISTVGTAVTFSTAKTFKKNDFVVITNGAQVGEQRQLTADVTASASGTIDAAFSSDQSGQTYSIAKNAKDVAWVNSIIHHIPGTGHLGQIQHGQQHWVYAQCDLLGAGYWFRNQTSITSSLGAFAVRAFKFFDCITTQIFASNDVGAELVIDNVHNEATSGNVFDPTADGAVTFDVNYRPTAGLSKTMLGRSSDGKPLLPFDINGRVIPNSGALVGAAQPT